MKTYVLPMGGWGGSLTTSVLVSVNFFWYTPPLCCLCRRKILSIECTKRKLSFHSLDSMRHSQQGTVLLALQTNLLTEGGSPDNFIYRTIGIVVLGLSVSTAVCSGYFSKTKPTTFFQTFRPVTH